jgi:hypothetical protein
MRFAMTRLLTIVHLCVKSQNAGLEYFSHGGLGVVKICLPGGIELGILLRTILVNYFYKPIKGDINE